MNKLLTSKTVRSLLVLGMTLTSLFISTAGQVKADNQDVLDQANVIDSETESRIKAINQEKLGKVKGKPQIAVVTRDSLKGTSCENIDEYGQQLFNKYKFGTKGYDNGVLILILVKDHRFRIQTGYGVEGALPDAYAHLVMADPKVKSSFKSSDYSQGVEIMVNKLTKRLTSHQKQLRSKSDVKNHSNNDSSAEITVSIVVGLVVIVVIIILANVLR